METWRKQLYSNELYHHGVLGMHWGIRRYQPYSTVPRGSGKGGKEIGEAKKAYKSLKRDRKAPIHGKMSQKSFDLLKEPVFNKENVQAAYNDYKDTRRRIEQAEDDFWNNEALSEKWIIKAADLAYKRDGGEKNVSGLTKKQYRDMYLYEDFDQGENNSYDLYLKSKGTSAREQEAIVLNKAHALEDQARQETLNYLGKYGNRTIGKDYRGRLKAKDFVAESISSNALSELWNDTHADFYKKYDRKPDKTYRY